MAKKTIRVDEPAFEEAKAQKEEQGQTWDEYLTDSNRTGPDADDVATELTARLNLDASEAKEEIEMLQELVTGLEEDFEEVKNQISMANEPGVEVDTAEIISEIEKLQELVENVPENTADVFDRKYGSR